MALLLSTLIEALTNAHVNPMSMQLFVDTVATCRVWGIDRLWNGDFGNRRTSEVGSIRCLPIVRNVRRLHHHALNFVVVEDLFTIARRHTLGL